MSASSRRILPWVVVSASRRSSASSALRLACSISLRRAPRCGFSIPTLRPARADSASSSSAAVGELAVDEDPPRRRHVLVELDEKARHHLGFRNVVGVRREESAMPPILPAANEEGLDRHGPALAGEREDVGIAEPFGMDRLAALDVGQRAQPVAVDGGKLEVLPLRRFGHQTCDSRA